MTKGKRRFRLALVILIVAIPTVTVLFALLRLFNQEKHEVFVKIKVSQGLWWASTSKPNLWLAQSIHKGDRELSFDRSPLAEIGEVRYYPFVSKSSDTITEDKYNIYLVAKLSAGYNSKKDLYTFKRNSLIIGSPIEIDTNRSQITGTVIAVSPQPFEDNYVEKKVTLIKVLGYTSDDPFLYLGIGIGQKYFDGEDNVVEITNKYLRKFYVPLSDIQGNLHENPSSARQDIVVEAKVKVRQEEGNFLFGEEKLLKNGTEFYLSTDSGSLEQFTVARVD